jgi:hypothetical protein
MRDHREKPRRPKEPSIIERMQQQRNGIPIGATCQHEMIRVQKLDPAKNLTRYSGGRRLGPCPRFAMKQVGTKYFCDCHGE